MNVQINELIISDCFKLLKNVTTSCWNWVGINNPMLPKSLFFLFFVSKIKLIYFLTPLRFKISFELKPEIASSKKYVISSLESDLYVEDAVLLKNLLET